MINLIASCCIKKDNKILMVQENKKEIEGLWNFPGGKVKDTENVKEAAVREILEETGYKVKIESVLLIQNHITPKGELLILYFNASLLDDNRKEYRAQEIKNVKWISLEEIKNISEENIRGGSSIKKLIHNIQNDIEYSIDILNIYENY